MQGCDKSSGIGRDFPLELSGRGGAQQGKLRYSVVADPPAAKRSAVTAIFREPLRSDGPQAKELHSSQVDPQKAKEMNKQKPT